MTSENTPYVPYKKIKELNGDILEWFFVNMILKNMIKEDQRNKEEKAILDIISKYKPLLRKLE